MDGSGQSEWVGEGISVWGRQMDEWVCSDLCRIVIHHVQDKFSYCLTHATRHRLDLHQFLYMTSAESNSITNLVWTL